MTCKSFIYWKLFISILIICYQTISTGQTTFNKTIDFDSSYEASYSVVANENTYYFMGDGYIAAFDYWRGLSLCKTDAEGNLIWQKTYGKVGSELFSSLNAICNFKGDLYLSGTHIIEQYVEANVILTKIDKETGDTIFFKEFYTDGVEVGYRISWLPDSTILIYGITNETGYNRILLMNIDTVGNIIFDKFYGTGIVRDSRYFQLDNSGNIYISYGDEDCDPRGYYFNIVDLAGEITGIYDYDLNCLEWGVPSLTDDGYYIASYDYYIYLSTFFAKLNSDYSYSWKNYFAPDWVYNLWAQYELDDGSVIVYGSKEYAGVEITYHAFLRKIDKNGNTVWEREYFTEKEIYHSYIWTLSETSDKGFICGGTGYGEPVNEFGGLSQNFWLLKLDSMGCLIPGCDTIDNNEEYVPIESNNAAIIVYPNPITTEATIQIDLAQLDLTNLTYFEVELTDLQGRILTEFTVDQFHWVRNGDYITLPLNRENWARGIYFIQIKAESKIIGNQKIVFQ